MPVALKTLTQALKHDTGCNLYARCLQCPLPRCRYDTDAPKVLESGKGRDLRDAQAKLRADIRADLAAKMTWDDIQTKHNCSRGLISKAKAEGAV